MTEKSKTSILATKTNVGNKERFASVLSGSYLIYNAFRKGSIIQALAAGYLMFRGATGFCPAYQALGLDSSGKTLNVNIKTRLTVNKPRSQVYQFWRKIENLPLFMKHLESVTALDEITSEWKAKIPGGMGTIDWTSEIVEDEPNEWIGWQSLPGSTIENVGNVHFRDAGKSGTEVNAVISYHAPGGKSGENLGKLLNPVFKEMVKKDIKNFKHYLETNELPTAEGQPSGKDEKIRV